MDFVLPAEIKSFASCGVKSEEILLFVAVHLTNYPNLGVYFVVSFRVSVSYTAVIIVVLVAMLVAILNADRDLVVYFGEQHQDDVGAENPVRYHAPVIDCSSGDSVMWATFLADAY